MTFVKDEDDCRTVYVLRCINRWTTGILLPRCIYPFGASNGFLFVRLGVNSQARLTYKIYLPFSQHSHEAGSTSMQFSTVVED